MELTNFFFQTRKLVIKNGMGWAVLLCSKTASIASLFSFSKREKSLQFKRVINIFWSKWVKGKTSEHQRHHDRVLIQQNSYIETTFVQKASLKRLLRTPRQVRWYKISKYILSVRKEYCSFFSLFVKFFLHVSNWLNPLKSPVAPAVDANH